MPAQAFTDNELERLAAFRSVARQVRDASVIAEARSIRVTITGRKRGEPIDVDTSGMLPTEALRSLAMAIRLAYMDKEPAHFFSICGFLRKGASQAQTERIDWLHAAWGSTKEGPQSFGYTLDGERITAGEVFHLWLNGIAFHQDPEKKRKYQILDRDAVFADLAVQATALQLAGRIMDLDDVIAEILDQEPIERIEPRAP